ncbi:MAG: peroxiredoxin [Phycisphaerales bacterium]|nr:peroxiredoxin [Phycisphaerales bacterium]
MNNLLLNPCIINDKVLSIDKPFPKFAKHAVVSTKPGEEFAVVTNDIHLKQNKWMTMFWWPKDFTFVCPTELAEFNHSYAEFKERDTVLVGASTDTEFVHLAWRLSHPDLKNLQYPMIADTSKSLAEELGILSSDERIAYRATFIVDPTGVIKWVSVYDLKVGRNVKEVLRVLDALQTDELCPCNWSKGQSTIKK